MGDDLEVGGEGDAFVGLGVGFVAVVCPYGEGVFFADVFGERASVVLVFVEMDNEGIGGFVFDEDFKGELFSCGLVAEGDDGVLGVAAHFGEESDVSLRDEEADGSAVY